MGNAKELTDRESITINIMKAFSVLSVIAAHVVPFSDVNFFYKAVSSFWCLFGSVGVIVFFVIGGFLYNRKPNDNKVFWKKKFFRIIVPWLVCSSLTYLVAAFLSHNFSVVSYLKWIIGSRTWYYYITIYMLFLFIFKWFYDKDIILCILIGIQMLSLILVTFGISTTISFGFITDYLNPLHWIGYFSFGILIRKYRLDLTIRKQKHIVVAYVLTFVLLFILSFKEIFTYFNIFSSMFCLFSLVILTDISYRIASLKIARHIGKIGIWSYCIYLLHMQIAQASISKIPNGIFKLVFAPFICLCIMCLLISVGLFICNKLQFGDKIKKIVGL